MVQVPIRDREFVNRGPDYPGHWAEDVLLGIGSNMGHRLNHLQQGLDVLASDNRISIAAVSSVFESEFVGTGEQNSYLNACVMLRTTLSPNRLLVKLKVIEHSRGREPDSHMQPRPLDLDILLFGCRYFQSSILVVPHPRMLDRSFVLEPLTELVPNKKITDSSETVAKVCAKIRVTNENRILVRDDLSLSPGTTDHKEE